MIKAKTSAAKKCAATRKTAACASKASTFDTNDSAVKTALKAINKAKKNETKAKPVAKVERKAEVKKAEVKKAKGVTLSVKLGSGKDVYIAGSFNNWDPKATPMTGDDNGVYSITLDLATGIYEYKFVIDGVWTLDPDPERDWTQNGLGTLNSVLRIG